MQLKVCVTLNSLILKIGKIELIWSLLQMCYQDRLTPKFFNFKQADGSLEHSKTYKKCQSMLLKEEIKTKSGINLKQEKEFEIVRNSIKKTVSLLHFAHSLVGNACKLVQVK